MRLVLRLLIFSCFISGLSAQTLRLSGRVTDSQGRPVAFASVYQKSTTIGTSTNSEGEYTLNLSRGKYEIVYQALSYEQQIHEVDLNNNQVLNISLNNETYELQSITIHSNGEDPAYQIIRNAIKMRKNHLQEIKSYSCEVYIKGVQKLLDAPKKFLGEDLDKFARRNGLDSNRRGILYLSESESKFSFSLPDKIHEEMIASKVSGSNRAFSFNRATDMKLNFYENLSKWDELSNRPMISPIADNALFYYAYKLIGTTQENGISIYKIQVIPKRKSDPVFRGNIYIIDDSWRIHSIGLYLTKDAGINLLDTLKINQQFFPVDSKIWMPSSVKFDFTGGLLNFRFGGYYIAVYKNYDLNPVTDKKSFSEVLRITKEVNKKDSIYWTQNRPVPLTEEEETDYEKKKGLALKRESKPYLDSLDKINNTFKIKSFIIGNGYNIRNRYKRENIHFSSLHNSVFYNTVEGFGLNYGISYTKQIDSLQDRRIVLSGKVRYGWSNEKAHISLGALIPVKKARLNFNVGSDVVDLNSWGTVSQLGNSFNSLLFEKNRQKFYEKRFAGISLAQRISGGLTGIFNAEWSNRKWLPNSSDYRIHDSETRVFTSNNPFTPVTDVPLFPENQSLKIHASLSYAFSAKYVTYPWGKYYLASKYPRLTINYSKGIKNILGSDVDYDFLSASISKAGIDLGLYGKTSFYFEAGKYLNNNQLYYTDYKHFVGNQTLVYQPRQNAFLLQDYYLYSTSDQYVEAHLEHNFSGFLLNKLPLIRKLKLQEIIGGNYLSTPAVKNYAEYYFGIKYLNIHILYGMSYSNGEQVHSAFRIAHGIRF